MDPHLATRISLVLAGTFFLLVRNMEELLDEFGDDLHVTVYLADGVSADRQRERQDHDEAEARVPDDRPQPVANVADHRL